MAWPSLLTAFAACLIGKRLPDLRLVVNKVQSHIFFGKRLWLVCLFRTVLVAAAVTPLLATWNLRSCRCSWDVPGIADGRIASLLRHGIGHGPWLCRGTGHSAGKRNWIIVLPQVRLKVENTQDCQFYGGKHLDRSWSIMKFWAVLSSENCKKWPFFTRRRWW